MCLYIITNFILVEHRVVRYMQSHCSSRYISLFLSKPATTDELQPYRGKRPLLLPPARNIEAAKVASFP